MLNMKKLKERKGTSAKAPRRAFPGPAAAPRSRTRSWRTSSAWETEDVEDAGEVLAEIRSLLKSDAPHISFSTTKTDQNGTPTKEQFLGADGKPEVGYTVFMIYLQKPDPTQDLQGAIYRSFGRNRGWDKDALAEINSEFRTALGIADESAGPKDDDRISDEEAAPASAGETQVLPS